MKAKLYALGIKILLFSILSVSNNLSAQPYFYKYLFQQKEQGGLSRGVSSGTTNDNGELVTLQQSSGFTHFSTFVRSYDDFGNSFYEFDVPDSLKPQNTVSSTTQFLQPVNGGFLINKYFGTSQINDDKMYALYFDDQKNLSWKMDNYFIEKIAFHEGFGYASISESPRKLISLNQNGTIRSVDSLQVNPLVPQYYLLSPLFYLGVDQDFAYVYNSNGNDSLQIVVFDSLGIQVSNAWYTDIKVHGIYHQGDLIFTVEEDSGLVVKFRNSQFQLINEYRFPSEFPLIYKNVWVKDSIITFQLANDVDGFAYGIPMVPEFHVINTNAEYLRKRYFRYNGAFNNRNIANFITPEVRAFGYSNDFGYYGVFLFAKGTYDAQYGLIKMDKDFRNEDTVKTVGVYIYLSEWDTLLTPLNLNSISPEKPSVTIAKFKIFPNPSSQLIAINSTITEEIKSIQIFNGLGQLITFNSSDFKVSPIEIDVSTFSNGIYFVGVTTENGTEFIRFIKN